MQTTSQSTSLASLASVRSRSFSAPNFPRHNLTASQLQAYMPTLSNSINAQLDCLTHRWGEISRFHARTNALDDSLLRARP